MFSSISHAGGRHAASNSLRREIFLTRHHFLLIRPPLKVAAEAKGCGDFTPLWWGQAAALCAPMPAAELTRNLAVEALAMLDGACG